MPRLLALNAEWKRNPPLQLLVKAFLGIKGEPDSEATTEASAFATLPDFEE